MLSGDATDLLDLNLLYLIAVLKGAPLSLPQEEVYALQLRKRMRKRSARKACLRGESAMAAPERTPRG